MATNSGCAWTSVTEAATLVQVRLSNQEAKWTASATPVAQSDQQVAVREVGQRASVTGHDQRREQDGGEEHPVERHHGRWRRGPPDKDGTRTDSEHRDDQRRHRRDVVLEAGEDSSTRSHYRLLGERALLCTGRTRLRWPSDELPDRVGQRLGVGEVQLSSASLLDSDHPFDAKAPPGMPWRSNLSDTTMPGSSRTSTSGPRLDPPRHRCRRRDRSLGRRWRRVRTPRASSPVRPGRSPGRTARRR